MIKFTRKKYLEKIKKWFDLYNLVYLTWTRQVGKTTIWKMFLEWKKHIYLSLDIYNFQNVSTTKDFLDYFKIYEWINLLDYDYLFFDEVKSFDNIWNVLKWFVDIYDKKILCSSSWNINIVKSIAKNLTGRYEIIQVYPLDFAEYLEDLDKQLFNQYLQLTSALNETFYQKIEKIFLQYLQFGALPRVLSLWYWKEQEKIRILENIIESIKNYDLSVLLNEKSKWKLEDLLYLFAEKNWSVLKIDKLVQEIWVKRNQLQQIINAINEVGLILFLKPFFTQKKYELSKANKVYFIDTGIYQTFLKDYNLIWEKKWKVIENSVFIQLLSNISNYDIYFWRNKNQYEIDFGLKNKLTGRLIPIESKSDDKDNIPKIFTSFAEKYWEKIEYFIKITKTLETQRIENLWGKKILIKFIPLFKLPIKV